MNEFLIDVYICENQGLQFLPNSITEDESFMKICN